jgi:uncharacterized membrane protein
VQALKRYFITGLLVWVPVVITVWVFMVVITTLDDFLPNMLRPENWFGRHIPGLGVVIIGVLIIGTGMFAANFIGQQMLEVWEGLLARIPVVKSIYGGVKQVSDTVFASDGKAFRKTVLIRFPHNDVWALAFITGEPGGELASRLPPDCVNVYVPTTPNPTGGYYLMVERKNLIELDMRVDTALKYVLSMGSVTPNGHHLPPEAKTKILAHK